MEQSPKSFKSLEVLRRLAGGDSISSFAALRPRAMRVSGEGDPDCEVCCDAGGEGYVACKGGGSWLSMSGGGEGELARKLRGEEVTLDGIDDRGLEEHPASNSVDGSTASLSVVAVICCCAG